MSSPTIVSQVGWRRVFSQQRGVANVALLRSRQLAATRIERGWRR